MWENLLNMATQSGIWAVLFVVLFYKQIKESKEREDRYQSTIDALADKLKMIAEIRSDIADIKNALHVGENKDAAGADEKKTADTTKENQ